MPDTKLVFSVHKYIMYNNKHITDKEMEQAVSELLRRRHWSIRSHGKTPTEMRKDYLCCSFSWLTTKDLLKPLTFVSETIIDLSTL